MKKSQLVTKTFNQVLDCSLESPYREKDGLLEFKEEFATPEFFANWSFVTYLYGEQVQVDHCVLTFPDLSTLEDYAKALRPYSLQTVEGLGLFPLDFCPNTYTISEDLWFHLLTMLMPSGGLMVLGAPHTVGDQLDRFVQGRGARLVHHVAFCVDDVHKAAWYWYNKGFHPLSKKPLNGDWLCQWFMRNSAGQIIELINRHPDNKATFDCQNIGELRRSELAK